ncbi:MAG: glycosyltransferase family 4 protein, partial [Bryobacteraceae bacterium]
ARSHTWAATLSGCPLVVSRRVAFDVGQASPSQWKYAKPRRYLAVSEYVKSRLLEAGIPESRIAVVYDGVALPASLSQGSELLALKTDDPMKGSDLIEEAARLEGLSVRYATDLPSDLMSAALFIYITRSEGLGSAALLAMAAGVPVVASRVGGLPEVVDDGVNGVLTDNEPSAIGGAIRRALQLRHHLSPNARRRVQERFSIAHMVHGTLQAYEQALA